MIEQNRLNRYIRKKAKIMKHCFECGSKLELKELEGEGMIPYCNSCQTYRFLIFSTAVSMIVLNPERNKVLLIQQYGKKNNILVAGYINKGECAEETVIREVKEEVGLEVIECTFNKSEYYGPSNTLMLNFSCVVANEDLSGMTKEVDRAQWFSLEEAKEAIMPNSLAKRFLLAFLDKNQRSN